MIVTIEDTDELVGGNPHEAIAEASKLLASAGVSFFIAVASQDEGPRGEVVPMAAGSVYAEPLRGLALLEAIWVTMGQYFAIGYEGLLNPDILESAVHAGAPKVLQAYEYYAQANRANTVSVVPLTRVGDDDVSH